ncbi:hypothetical protein [Propionispora hippei]|uniref:hypothetical protein n=1 Tax=Propionispora hippei TaxID=209080 RepID=UPI00122C4D45|nr:hypothetical protein [Propionispora hippei]
MASLLKQLGWICFAAGFTDKFCATVTRIASFTSSLQGITGNIQNTVSLIALAMEQLNKLSAIADASQGKLNQLVELVRFMDKSK